MRCLFLATLFWVSSTAFAQENRERARVEYEAGVFAYQSENWVECARSFERSFAIVFAPELLYNIGVCWKNAGISGSDVGQLRRARSSFVRYLRELPDSEDAEVVSAEIRELEILISSRETAEAEAGVEAEVEEPPIENEPQVQTEHERIQVTRPYPFEVPVSPDVSDGFGFRYTVGFSVLTLVSVTVASVLGLRARDAFNTCNTNCTIPQKNRIMSLARGANILFGAAATLAVSTSVSFALEWRNNANSNSTSSFRLGLQFRF